MSQGLRTVAAAGRLAWRAGRLGVLAMVALALIGAAAPVAVAWFTKLVFDSLAGPGPSGKSLVPLVAGLGIAGLAAAALPQLGQYLRAELQRRLELVAQDELYEAVERQVGLRRFEDPDFLDRLHFAQQSGGASPVMLVDAGLRNVAGAFAVVSLLASLAIVSTTMAAVVLGAAVPAIAAELALSRRRTRVAQQVGAWRRREFFYSSLLTEARSVKELRLFGFGGFVRERMLAARRRSHAALRSADRWELGLQGGLGISGAAVGAVGLLWAAGMASAGALTIGDVSMFIAAIAGLQAALTSMAQAIAAAHGHLMVFSHYREVVATPPDLLVGAAPGPLPPLRHGIELRDVWFRHSPEHPWVLRGVNLFIPAGQTVAIVGANGCGKTTLVKLLCRFYDPTEGVITWDGRDLRELDVSALRQSLGATFQDFMHYDLSAAENIGIGAPQAMHDRGRVAAAAQRAGIHDILLGLPAGYDTALSRGFTLGVEGGNPAAGVLLSGGQWQRVALARAYMKHDVDLLILDEPSSGLDPVAEHEVHSSLRLYRAGRTSVLVSHRLGAVRDADRIVVLADGRIREDGDHDTLVTGDGIYARLFRTQAAGYRVESGA